MKSGPKLSSVRLAALPACIGPTIPAFPGTRCGTVLSIPVPVTHGIRAGAEMTTFEMRFIALRCKDTISPTGTIAQGVGAKQINARGEVYEQKYGLTTSQRLYGTVRETLDGNGPCYLGTEGITPAQDESLLKAYLNMAPSQTLKWIESGKLPSQQNVEIEGTEPMSSAAIRPAATGSTRTARRQSATSMQQVTLPAAARRNTSPVPGRRGDCRQRHGPPGPDRCDGPR